MMRYPRSFFASGGVVSDRRVPPVPYFQFEVSNVTGTPPAATSLGTGYTSGGSSADGTAVTLLSALAQDVQSIIIGIAGQNTAAEDNSALGDLLVDPAGGTAWASLVDDLIVGNSETVSASSAMSVWYHFPLYVKAGSSLGFRARKAGATGVAGRVVIRALGQPVGGTDSWWAGTGVETLGAVPASSAGTAITPGNTGTYSSYVTIGTSTKRYRAIQLGCQGGTATANALGYFFELGVGSAAVAGMSRAWRATNASEAGFYMGAMSAQHCSIASGTVIQARATCSGTAQAMQVTSYGTY